MLIRFTHSRWGAACAAALMLSVTAAPAAVKPVRFSTDILPILSDKCYLCHGPDAESRKGKLRLDLEEEAKADRGGHFVIVPGDPEASSLVERVRTKDPDDIMPPPDSHKTLEPAEIDVLVRWVKEGAVWGKHWAYEPPVKTEAPVGASDTWSRTAIDRLVRARLREAGLTPAEEADRATLLRRVCLDVTGLPPSPAELRAFLSDTSPDAYEKVVDRLLASPAWGEHRARYWLDAARYGDTHGFHIDNYRSIWPYRDWVVNAFNANMPFDQFTVEQLAGDLLPNATVEQRVATGFNRCNPTTNEGGIIDEEFAVRYGIDRVETTTTVWMGMTAGCAACHDHKFDPITTKEFYQLFAFFNNSTQRVRDGNVKDSPPVIRVPSPKDRARYDQLHGDLESVALDINHQRDAARKAFEVWSLTQHQACADQEDPLTQDLLFHLPLIEGEGRKVREYVSERELQLVGPANWQPSLRRSNLALGAKASSPDKIDKDGGSTGDAAAVDGDPETFWDEVDNQKLYIYRLDLPVAREVARLALTGFEHHHFAPRDFELRLNDQAVTHVTGAAYINNRFELPLPATVCSNVELRITGYYGNSPAIRELELYEPTREDQHTTAPAFGGKSYIKVGDLADVETHQAYSVSAWVFNRGGKGSQGIVSRMDAENFFRGWDLYLGGKNLVVHLISHWQDNALRASTPIPANTWVHVLVTYDGSGKGSGLKCYLDGEEAPLKVDTDSLSGSVRTDQPVYVGRRGRGGVLKDAYVQDVRFYQRALKRDEVRAVRSANPLQAALARAPARRSETENRMLFNYYLRSQDPDFQNLLARQSALIAEQEQIRARGIPTLISEEKPGTPKAYVLTRGEYDQRAEEVAPEVPAALPLLDPNLPRNRLGLARWLVDPAHPLTARVTVNRFWQSLFGSGLVKTTEDFGLQGDRPSNPELLDWLAVDFVENAWDVKRFYRQVLLSSTYRQAAVSSPEKITKDPDNRLLSRGPRFRLDAEVLRDQALAVSGLLVHQQGGPPVKPWQPDGLWLSVSYPSSDTARFKADGGDKRLRRSLYTFWKRTSPPPFLEILNAPSRESCTVRRERTNTPLQALLTLNEPLYFESARQLATRSLQFGGFQDRDRLDYMTTRLLGRQMDDPEKKIIFSGLEQFRATYRNDPEAAGKVLGIGDSKIDPELNRIELAAWTLVANQLMNLDEALNKN